jgi:hypothetical protein
LEKFSYSCWPEGIRADPNVNLWKENGHIVYLFSSCQEFSIRNHLIIILVFEGHQYCCFNPQTCKGLWKKCEDLIKLERLFSVYKVEGKTKILLGGLVERRKSRRRKSNRSMLMEMAKRKFAESSDEDIKIILSEEK